MDDLDLQLPCIALGDSTAFGRFMTGAEAALREFAAKVDVEAVLQEALLRAWQVAPRIRTDGP